MKESLDPLNGVSFDPDTTCTTGSDWNLSASEVNRIVRKMSEFPMDAEAFEECVVASRKNLRHDDGRIVNGAVANLTRMAKHNQDKVAMLQRAQLARESQKIEVDHNHQGAVLVMPAGYADADITLPEATPDVIETCKAIQDGDSD